MTPLTATITNPAQSEIIGNFTSHCLNYTVRDKVEHILDDIFPSRFCFHPHHIGHGRASASMILRAYACVLFGTRTRRNSPLLKNQSACVQLPYRRWSAPR